MIDGTAAGAAGLVEAPHRERFAHLQRGRHPGALPAPGAPRRRPPRRRRPAGHRHRLLRRRAALRIGLGRRRRDVGADRGRVAPAQLARLVDARAVGPRHLRAAGRRLVRDGRGRLAGVAGGAAGGGRGGGPLRHAAAPAGGAGAHRRRHQHALRAALERRRPHLDAPRGGAAPRRLDARAAPPRDPARRDAPRAAAAALARHPTRAGADRARDARGAGAAGDRLRVYPVPRDLEGAVGSEAALAAVGRDRVLALIRADGTRGGSGHLLASWSEDGGRCWTLPVATDIWGRPPTC